MLTLPTTSMIQGTCGSSAMITNLIDTTNLSNVTLVIDFPAESGEESTVVLPTTFPMM